MDEQDEFTKMLQHSLDTEVARIEEQFDKLWDAQAPFIAMGQGVQDALHAKGHESHRLADQYRWFNEDARAEAREKLSKEVAELIRLGIDFKLLLEAMVDNPMLKSHWDKTAVLLRLAVKPK